MGNLGEQLVQSELTSHSNLLSFVAHFQIPNGLGALFGMAQLLLFFIYRNAPPVVAQQLELNEAGTPTETQPPSIHIISTDCD
jgi:hypothetical protein